MIETLAQTDLGNLPHIVMVCYLIMLLTLGVIGYLKSKNTEEDYYLAGRKQGFIVSALTIMATFFSSWAMLGAPGMVYRDGVAFILFALNVPFSGSIVYLIGSRISRLGRAKGYVTPADLVTDYYGDSAFLRILVALVGFLYVLPYVVIQIRAGGHLAQQIFPDIKPMNIVGIEFNIFQMGSSVLAVITMLYIIVGGMRSVAWTDVIQGGLLLAGMLIAGLATVVALGGIGDYFNRVSTELPKHALSVPGTSGTWTPWKMMTICMFASLGSMIQPAQWMRYYAARSVNALRRSALIFAVVLTGCFLFGVMLVGLGGRVLYPPTEKVVTQQTIGDTHDSVELKSKIEVTPHEKVKRNDQILVTVLNDHAPKMLGDTLAPILISIILVAILAASMSTADSNLHALSGVLTRDVYDRFIRRDASQSERTWVGRILIVVVTLLAVWLVRVGDQNPEFKPLKMIVEMGLLAIAFSTQLLPATIDILFVRRASRIGIICGILAGLAVVLMFTPVLSMMAGGTPGGDKLLGHVGDLKKLLDVGFCGLVVNTAVCIIISLFTRKPDTERKQEFENIMRRM